jgi:hypothetical protein
MPAGRRGRGAGRLPPVLLQTPQLWQTPRLEALGTTASWRGSSPMVSKQALIFSSVSTFATMA